MTCGKISHLSPAGDARGGGMTTVRIALAQINSTVGDLTGNERKIMAAIGRARELGADVVALP